ncbi:putative photosynthetic complex assembly protein PuhE [uncultured Roseobacter sp.]|uniref:putative photosynthetic complex assembly protein PuhE n=1 Tax=uncultured Roseobacter sp. TaxID=114847 RepID=UPI002620432F|nr:putative photosynthetic complex assembly protein PuhE [uncultured Roseobacter sp.]
MSFWTPALFALFIWWFSTGAILWVVKSADRSGLAARKRAVVSGLPFLALGCLGFWASLYDTSVFGAYLGFVAALAIWGWIELAFLTGVITGPNHHELPKNVPEWERFIRAWGTLAYHEMLLVATLIAMVLIDWNLGAENKFATWTFAVLFFARLSAKLNLFFGVPKINIEFLPEALAHLPSHFRHRAMNWFFPVSITALTFAAACWLERLYAAQTTGAVAGFTLLTAITVLALFEHWMMVLPIPDEKLWRWMIPTDTPTKNRRNTDVIPTAKIKGGHHGL